jgi:hypothetical protein
MMFEKTTKFLIRNGMQLRHIGNDEAVMHCNFCGKEGWTPTDIKHKKTCEIGIVLKELEGEKK